MSRQVLILFAHPALHRSRINKSMLNQVTGLDNITVQNLYESYPDFYIDVHWEQALLLNADLVVFQHPLYWYSAPPLLKLWQDVVLEKGFAYGGGGDALRGKDFMLAISSGGQDAAYQPGGYHSFYFHDFLRPFEALANFCGMQYHKPFVIQGGDDLTEDAIQSHSQAYRLMLQRYITDGFESFADPV
jgi:glutathione-regulated potassium-efflux system ancillary protein KefG